MYQQQYKMAVIVSTGNENDPQWPSKRIWFDASDWLRDPQYLKINDFYLLKLKYHPIDNLNDFGITLSLQEAIKNSVGTQPQLKSLNNMNNQDFFHCVKNKLSYEYLRSEFNSENFKPTEDYFLIFFSYDGVKYEVELLRTFYKGDFLFMTHGLAMVNKAGYWHAVSPAQYSYRDYIKENSIK
ncbi:hypothetical protein ACWPSR_000068 [Cronobacter turicensis]|uniref:hypothetical protein n=1 Tax=Cronobacter turicensis TaxID=413502 RepID=UPI0024C2D43B|nr:hypothetical protein [Cronobacter turicensis]MDK1334367.1 hypothetical protein [Cronobacter turicensis]